MQVLTLSRQLKQLATQVADGISKRSKRLDYYSDVREHYHQLVKVRCALQLISCASLSTAFQLGSPSP